LACWALESSLYLNLVAAISATQHSFRRGIQMEEKEKEGKEKVKKY